MGKEWRKHPPAAGCPPLPCFAVSFSIIRFLCMVLSYMLVVAVFPYFFLDVPLGLSLLIVNWNVMSLSLPQTYYMIHSFQRDVHERLCSLNIISLMFLYCASVTPGNMEKPEERGNTTQANCMYLQPGFGSFQKAPECSNSSPAQEKQNHNNACEYVLQPSNT